MAACSPPRGKGGRGVCMDIFLKVTSTRGLGSSYKLFFFFFSFCFVKLCVLKYSWTRNLATK